jgi:hypothetical protein
MVHKPNQIYGPVWFPKTILVKTVFSKLISIPLGTGLEPV